MVQATANGYALALAEGSNANASLYVGAKGTGSVRFSTSSTSITEQMRVAHTASAVNYVQVTGAATTASPVISAQGSDSNIGITLQGKGTGSAILQANSTGNSLLATDGGLTAIRAIPRATSGDTWLDIQRAVSSVIVKAESGTATNADLNLTTKGTGSHVFNTGSGRVFSATDHPFTGGGANVNYTRAFGGQTGYSTGFLATGTDSNIVLAQSSKGASAVQFYTGAFVSLQLNVAHTASAVNYVQVTGAATGSGIGPSFAAAGSDAAVPLTFTTKSTGAHRFVTGAGLAVTFVDSGGTTANFLQIQGRQAGNGPIISAQGSDPNVDINFTPKGTGNMRFGTYTGTISAITGYIEIKDSGGTVRRLAVVA
jgi:hypothetical protein